MSKTDVRSEAIKDLEENTGGIFLNNFKMEKAFLSKAQNPEATKGNIDEFDYIKIWNSYVENKHPEVKKIKKATKPEGEEKRYTQWTAYP